MPSRDTNHAQPANEPPRSVPYPFYDYRSNSIVPAPPSGYTWSCNTNGNLTLFADTTFPNYRSGSPKPRIRKAVFGQPLIGPDCPAFTGNQQASGDIPAIQPDEIDRFSVSEGETLQIHNGGEEIEDGDGAEFIPQGLMRISEPTGRPCPHCGAHGAISSAVCDDAGELKAPTTDSERIQHVRRTHIAHNPRKIAILAPIQHAKHIS